MGTLTPGATYIYERVDDKIYARETGSAKRKLIGYDNSDLEYRQLQEESILWREVLTSAKTNPSLQKALDRAIMIYRLSKDDPQ
jgi:hypothetical protein